MPLCEALPTPFQSLTHFARGSVTLVLHVHAGAVVRGLVMVAKISTAMRAVAVMWETFRRDYAIDDAARGELAAIIKCVPPPPSLSSHPTGL